MEKIQEGALRFIYEDFNSDFDTLLLKSSLPFLKIRRLRMMAIEIFKILHKQSPAYLNDIVSFKHISYSFGRRQTVEIPQLRTTNVGTTIQSELILVPPMVYLYWSTISRVLTGDKKCVVADI